MVMASKVGATCPTGTSPGTNSAQIEQTLRPKTVPSGTHAPEQLIFFVKNLSGLPREKIFKKISTHRLTVLTSSVITQIEQGKQRSR